MIPLTILYDEYIDRPKLTEQKNPVEYKFPPSPLKWGSEQKLATSFLAAIKINLSQGGYSLTNYKTALSSLQHNVWSVVNNECMGEDNWTVAYLENLTACKFKLEILYG